MQIAGIKGGDILHLEVRGGQFHAIAKGGVEDWNGRRGIQLLPLGENHRLYTQFVTARQVIGHYSKRKGSR